MNLLGRKRSQPQLPPESNGDGVYEAASPEKKSLYGINLKSVDEQNKGIFALWNDVSRMALDVPSKVSGGVNVTNIMPPQPQRAGANGFFKSLIAMLAIGGLASGTLIVSKYMDKAPVVSPEPEVKSTPDKDTQYEYGGGGWRE